MDFLFVIQFIYIGRVFIVNEAGKMIGVSTLTMKDWALIVGFTSLIFIIPDTVRCVQDRNNQ